MGARLSRCFGGRGMSAACGSGSGLISVITALGAGGHSGRAMLKRFPADPPHPERVCWGCDRYCPSKAMACGNGSERTQHPVELFGPDWQAWGLSATEQPSAAAEDQAMPA